jgi:hypothetical protein
VSFSERRLLRRIQRFCPPGATVVAVDVGHSHDLNNKRLATSFVLTDRALLLRSKGGVSSVVTTIPFEHVFKVDQSEIYPILEVGWMEDGVNERSAVLDFTDQSETDDFIDKFFEQLTEWKARYYQQERNPPAAPGSP